MTSTMPAAAQRCAGRPNENWTVDAGVVYQEMDANTYAEENLDACGPRACGRAASWTRTASDEWTQVALTLQGDLGCGQFTSATQLLHAHHRLLPGQHRLHVLPRRPTGALRPYYATLRSSAPTRWASAGATGPTRTGSRRNSGCRARPKKRPGWLACSTRTSRMDSTSSRASRTTRIRRLLISGDPTTASSRARRTTLLSLEERPEDGAISRHSASSATRRTRTGR